MILIETGEQSDRSFDAKVLFAAQLAARGHAVALDDATLPEGLDRSGRYEAARYLRTLANETIDRLIVIGAEAIAEPLMIRLRQIRLAPGAPVNLIGRFPDRQALISAQSKIAYVTGREPQIVDLARLQPAALPGIVGPTVALRSSRNAPAGAPLSVVIFPTPELLAEPGAAANLMAMEHLPGIRVTTVLAGRARDYLKSPTFAPARLIGLSDLAPAAFARMADLAVVYGKDALPPRIAAVVADMVASGLIVIDGTSEASLAATGAPVLRGPLPLAALGNYLRHTVLINREEIARRIADDPWIAPHRVETLEALIGLEAAPAKPEGGHRDRTLFLPTNGNGLGHARRSLLVAQDLPDTRQVAFAAFPSCVPMIRAAGYNCLPLVSKSPTHDAEHANDLVNYMRLGRALRPGDRLVFDGGYVFDSIYRTILEKGLDAAWIRRGLWQAGQITPAALHRESAFARVIVPEEAFPELNRDMSFGSHLHKVGPIVSDRPGREAGSVRDSLRARLGREFSELVVTMLGGGVAADRTAQLQLLSALFERRPGCLHLILIWPGSTIHPGLYGWKNTIICQTRNAAGIAAAADLTVTAAGYNSYHEVLYHRLPAIFVPQMAGFMDDQERRAQAASERGLAVTVAAEDLLLLEREVAAFLDGGKGQELRRALASAELPQPGNSAAARLIAAEEWR